MEKPLSALNHAHGAERTLAAATREARRGRVRDWLSLCAFELAVLLGLTALGIPQPGTLHLRMLLGLAMIPPGIYGGIVARRRRLGLTTALSLCADKRALPLLIASLTEDDRQARANARTGLVRLLPTVDANDGPQFSRTQRDALYTALHSALRRPDPEFVLAAITGLARLGDTVGLATVRRMAALALRYSRRPDARALAAKVTELLPELEQTAAAAHAHQQLLRASGELAGATLPRPASPAAHSELPRQADQPAAAAEPGSAPAEAALRARP